MTFKIPAVGESIASGLISAWHKSEGAAVAAGEALLTLETDKVSTELTAETAGILHIHAPAGQEVKIGEIVGRIETGGAGPAKPAAPPKKAAAPQPVPAPSPTPAPAPAPLPPVELASAPAAPEPAVIPSSSPESRSSPISEALAAAPAASDRPTAPPPEQRTGRMTRKRMSPIRRKIAAQLVMAQQTAAILTTFNECDMSAVIALRGQMQESFVKEHGVKLGFMSFFVKAAVSGLKAVPAINSRLDGEDQIQNHYFDLGVAVGTERGLVVPVIRDAEAKSFAQIEKEIAGFALKARENKLKIEDLQGGVFTISNGGIYGSLLSTPILNPPQSGNLGMHKMQDRPIAENGQVVIRTR